jgi:signal transduction histidine kinase
VVGARPELAALCRDAIPELPEVEWTLIEATSGAEVPEVDLIVWDFQPDGPIPQLDGVPSGCQYVCVVHESCIETLCRRLPIAAAASIFVEPAQPGEIRDFLARVFRRHVEASRSRDPRKADRDELFQALLVAGFKLNEFRDERGHFFRRALRDLRGPLTALGGYCGLLLDQRLGPLSEAQLDVLRQMQDSADRLSNLLSSTLQLSQGVLEPSEVRLKPGDITVVLDRAVAQVMPSAEASEIEIRLDAIQPAEVLHFDLRLIHEALVCLLSNACRFTSHRGVVEVRGYPVLIPEAGGGSRGESWVTEPSNGFSSSNGYRIDIRDFGVAIPPGCLSSAFELSASCGGGSDRSEGGLGLAMCKMILDAHKGEIHVESSESGTVFSVILPHMRHGRPYFEQS